MIQGLLCDSHSFISQRPSGPKKSRIETGITARLTSFSAPRVSHWARWPPITLSCPMVAWVHGPVWGSQDTSIFWAPWSPIYLGVLMPALSLGHGRHSIQCLWTEKESQKKGKKKVSEEGRLSGWAFVLTRPESLKQAARGHSLALALAFRQGSTVAPVGCRALCVWSPLEPESPHFTGSPTWLLSPLGLAHPWAKASDEEMK